MTFIDFFTWFVLLITIATVVVVFVFMGLWPGKVASQSNHPLKLHGLRLRRFIFTNIRTTIHRRS